MRSLTIGSRTITDDSEMYVIAEIGCNHSGSIGVAHRLVSAAAECGVSAVKFQKRDNRALYTREMYNRSYEHEASYGPTYGTHREALELSAPEYATLMEYARACDLDLFATAFDVPSADFLAWLDVPAFKMASGDLTNTPLLAYVAGLGKPMFVSTGAADMNDVMRAVETVWPINQQICLMQCTATYPCKADDLDLRVIETYRAAFPDITIGLSTHFNGISMGPVAYALGARVLEQHFTLDRTMKGTDHAFSLEPVGMSKLVRDLKRVHVALGDGVKKFRPDEQSALEKMGKSIVAARDLPAHQWMTPADFACKTPGGGLPPHMLDQLVGTYLKRAVKCDERLYLGDFYQE